MQFNVLLRQLISERDLEGLQPGALGFFRAQEKIIKRKPLLKRSFIDFYQRFKADLSTTPNTEGLVILELGSGGGFLKEVIPNVITSDINHGIADLTIDARQLPFKDMQLKGVFMASVLHHIPNVRVFFKELDRCLATGGICSIVEPSNTWFSRIFYRKFHHEPFLLEQKDWAFDQRDAMMDANQALSWIVFVRDRNVFENEFPNLKIEKICFVPTFSYLFSGGVNYRAIIPNWLSWIVPFLERRLTFLNKYFSLVWYIVIRKV